MPSCDTVSGYELWQVAPRLGSWLYRGQSANLDSTSLPTCCPHVGDPLEKLGELGWDATKLRIVVLSGRGCDGFGISDFRIFGIVPVAEAWCGRSFLTSDNAPRHVLMPSKSMRVEEALELIRGGG